MLELKPCPFCGGEAVFYTLNKGGKHEGHIVGCPSSGCLVKPSVSKPGMTGRETVEAWNKRANDAD